VGEQPHYSTWIRTRKIAIFWAISLALVAIGLGLGYAVLVTGHRTT
jgi:hypothetical protein